MATDDAESIDDPAALLEAQQAHAQDDLARHLESRRGALHDGAVWGRDAQTGARVPLNETARQRAAEAASEQEAQTSARAAAKAEIIRSNTEAGRPWWRGLPADVLDAEELAELPGHVRDAKAREGRRVL